MHGQPHIRFLDSSSRNYAKDLEQAFELLGFFFFCEGLLSDIIRFVYFGRFEEVKKKGGEFLM